MRRRTRRRRFTIKQVGPDPDELEDEINSVGYLVGEAVLQHKRSMRSRQWMNYPDARNEFAKILRLLQVAENRVERAKSKLNVWNQ